MSVKYEALKKLVVAVGLKKRWLSATTEELLENRRKQNAKNRIPALKDDAFDIGRIDVMGFPVLKLIHRERTDRANLFLIGGGMISAPRPASVKKALRFARIIIVFFKRKIKYILLNNVCTTENNAC